MKRMLAALALLGCSPPYAEMAMSTSSSDAGPSTSTSTSTSTSGDATTGETSTSADVYMTTFSIMHPPDLGPYAPECDLFSQDCPPGEKCMPWANDGGGAWNDVSCFPVARDPKQLGEPCTVSGSAVSGIDDCARGTMCWDVDPDTGLGECVQICHGSEANPLCDAPCATCALGAVLVLCLPSCDPLAQDCSEGLACVPVADSFVCANDTSGTFGVVGDVCDAIGACDPGLLCANSDHVPGCESSGCCTPFCNMDAPDDCAAQLPGSACRAWFEPGEFPNTCYPTGTIGFCAVPQ